MQSILFPGQGSQVVGMGSEFYRNFDTVKKIFSRADDRLNFSISKLILEGPEDKLQLTENTQPAILTVSYSIYEILIKEFNFNVQPIKYFAGHSLGEYSALVCSGALNFEDALYLLNERGKAMQKAVPLGEGSMIAVLGAKIDQIRNLLTKIREQNRKNVCEIANDNADGQIILSGDTNGIEKCKELLKDEKIKSIPLKVSAPFHCSLMKSAADEMSEKILKTNFNNLTTEVISNVTAKPEKNVDIIKKLLIRQIHTTVRWRESLIKMFDDGNENFIEIGPGKVLTGMAKRTIKNANCFSINSIADIKNLINELKK